MDSVFYWVGLLVTCFSIGYSVIGILWWLALRTIANAGNLSDFVIYSYSRKTNRPGGE